MERTLVDVGGLSMCVMQCGQGRPVLMLHGNPTWGFLYRKVAAELRDEPLRLIMPDLIGLGFSDKPTDPTQHQLDRHATWLGRLIEELDLKDLVFVGQDWGGPIGLRALADQPDRVHGLVVLNTVIGPPKPNFKPTTFHRLSQTPVLSDLLFRGAQFPQTVLGLAQGRRKSISGAVARAYRYPLRKYKDRWAPLALARMVPDSLEHPTIEPLRRCQAFIDDFHGPAAIVWGDKDPILGRVRSHVERSLPDAEITRTNGGHFIQEEAAPEIAQAIVRVAGRSGRR
jgi:haloalkane dehalogenase